MSKVSYYTAEGLKKLRDELNQLRDVERPKASQAIAEARDKGDLSENAEYDAAKEAQGMLEMKISKLEESLANARLIDESQLDASKVLVLSTVKIKNQTIDKIRSKYQTIIYFDVLEHIKNDLREVKTASKKIKKNGRLIFNVPAHQLFYNKFDKAVGHFKRYNKKDFREIEKKTDLKIEKLIYYDSIGLLFLILNKIFKLKETNLKNKIYFWNMLIPLSKIIDKLTLNKFGKSLLCVFTK